MFLSLSAPPVGSAREIKDLADYLKSRVQQMSNKCCPPRHQTHAILVPLVRARNRMPAYTRRRFSFLARGRRLRTEDGRHAGCGGSGPCRISDALTARTMPGRPYRVIKRNLIIGFELTSLAHEHANWRRRILHGCDRLVGSLETRKLVFLVDGKSAQALERQVQDARKLGAKLGLQFVVLFAQPRARRQEQHEAADDGARYIAQARQFI